MKRLLSFLLPSAEKVRKKIGKAGAGRLLWIARRAIKLGVRRGDCCATVWVNDYSDETVAEVIRIIESKGYRIHKSSVLTAFTIYWKKSLR